MAIQKITAKIIADGAIIATDIADGSITTAKIADGNVTSAKIDTVANTKITGNIISSQIASDITLNGNTTVTTLVAGAGSNTAPAITTAGDTNTGIFFPAADTIAFTEGGVEALRIDSSGNVGIGTLPTNGRLVVNGNIIPSGAPNTFWGIDYAPVDGTGNSYVTLAFGATYDLASGSGIVFIMENSSSVGVLIAQCAYGATYIVSDPAGRYSTVFNTVSKVNFYYNAGTGTYRIQNNYSSGTTYSFWVATIRVRATT